MGTGTQLLFSPLVLDTPIQSLLCGTEKIVLTLCPGAKVGDAASRVSIREFRKALNDNAEIPSSPKW